MGLCSDEDFRVEGYCPACGKQALNLVGGKLECFARGCPAPDTAAKVLNDPETEHIVRFDEHGHFTVRHPLRERAGDLLECSMTNVVVDQMDMGYAPKDPGTYRLVGIPEIITSYVVQEPDWAWEEID